MNSTWPKNHATLSMPAEMPLSSSRCFSSIFLPSRSTAACSMGMTTGRMKPATPPKLTLNAAKSTRTTP